MWISSASILPVTTKSFCIVTLPAKFDVPSTSTFPVIDKFPLALILFEPVMFANFTSSVVPTLWFPNEPLTVAALRVLITPALAPSEPLIEAASLEPLTVAELKVLIVDALAPSEPLISVDI